MLEWALQTVQLTTERYPQHEAKMKWLYFYVLCLQLLLLVQSQVLPDKYALSSSEARSCNGSSSGGQCSEFTTAPESNFVCNRPSTSVLLDRNIPILTGLDGNMWASQLLTITAQEEARKTAVVFYFSSLSTSNRIGSVEIAMFNCPQWGISVQGISLLQSTSHSGLKREAGETNITITSCDSLVRVCLNTSALLPVLTMEFTLSPGADWVHLAEVGFYGPGGDRVCQQEPLVESSQEAETPSQCPRYPASAIAITAIITALLATVIFVLVLFAVCKCHPKFKPPRAETGTVATRRREGRREYGEGRREYGEEDGDGTATLSDHTYVEIVNTGGPIQLRQNGAYASRLSSCN